MAPSNASQQHQINLTQHLDWVWQMFGLRISQKCRDGEVGVEENQEKMCR